MNPFFLLFISLICLEISWGNALALSQEDPYPWIPIASPQPHVDSNWQIHDYLEDADILYKSIFHIDFESNGTAWIATTNGLYRYDGYRWQQFTEKDGLPSRFIRSVLVTHDNTLWVGTDRGAGIYNGTTFRTDLSELNLAGPSVRRMVEESDGTIWFCCDPWKDDTISGGLTSKKDGVWTTYREADGLPSKYVMDFFRDSHNRIYALTNDGLGVLENGQWSQPLKEAGLISEPEPIWDITESPTYGVIVSTATAQFVCQDNRWSQFPMAPNIPKSPKNRLCKTRDGQVFTFQSLNADIYAFQRWDGKQFIPDSYAFTKLPGGVEFIKEAPDRSIWVVGFNTLIRWDRQYAEWTTLDIPNPLFSDEKGRIWFQGDRTLVKEDDQWFQIDGFQGFLKKDAKQRVWGGTKDRILRLEKNQTAVYTKDEHGLQSVDGLVADAEGNIWGYGKDKHGENRVTCFTENQWQDLTPDSLRASRILQSQTDARKGIWLLILPEGKKRVQVLHCIPTPVQTPNEIDGPLFPIDSIEHLEIDPSGNIWICGKEGLAYYDLTNSSKKEWLHFSGIPDRDVFSIVFREQEKWFGFRSKKNQQGEIATFQDDKKGWHYYPLDAKEFGKLESNETIYFGGQSQIFIIPPRWNSPPHRLLLPIADTVLNVVPEMDNTLWIQSEKSVLRYIPNLSPPETQIVDPIKESIEGETLQFHFTGIDRFIPKRFQRDFRFSWRINHGQWTPFQTIPPGGLPLAGLAPGQYTLQVLAQNDKFIPDAIPEQTHFYVHPIFLQHTWWFRSLAFLAFFLISILAFYSLRAKRKLASYAENLEAMVEARTRDLKVSEAKYANLFEHVPDPIILWDPDSFDILDANPAAERVYGYTREEFIRKKTYDVSAEPEKTVHASRLLIRNVNNEVPLRYHIKKDGTVFPLEISGGVITLNERVCAFGIFRDITERKKNEEKLRFHGTVLENMTDWVTTTDLDFKITYVSPSIHNVLGLKPEDLIGKKVFDVYTPTKILSSSYENISQRILEESWQGEVVYHRQDGEKIIIGLHVGLLHDENGNPVGTVGVARDITKMKQLEEQLQQAQKIQAIGQLAGGIAHDFNNLLTGIIGNLNIALLHVNDLVHPYLKNAEKAANRAADLVRQLLAFSHKSHIELRPIHLDEVVDEVYNLARYTIDRRIEIVVQKEESLPCVFADKAQIITALMNLCLNSRDAIEEVLQDREQVERTTDHFTILIKIRKQVITPDFCRNHLLARPGTFVCIGVSDNGIGMSPEVQQHLFEPFFTTKEVNKGTGLGLSSVYGCVTQHHGWIELSSQEGIGSTFHLFLPASEEQEEIPVSCPTPEETPIQSSHETILVVDDEEMLRTMVQDILEDIGYRVLLASDGEEALDMVKQQNHSIDLVLLDISMPKQSGWEVLQTIRDFRPTLKVILCSGYALSESPNPELQSTPYLAKPYRPDKLIQTVREILDRE